LDAGVTPGDWVGGCVADLIWSAERAIPLSHSTLLSAESFGTSWERVEYYVPCVLQHPHDCVAIQACSTSRRDVSCEEDGCWIYENNLDYTVTCNGTFANVVVRPSTSFGRDCARAFAECSVTSPTGCTDRLLTTCGAGANPDDHCDGNVRLGCDRSGQRSYHDCARLGGICGPTAHGDDCIYQDPPDPECPPMHEQRASCIGSTLSLCVNGKRVSVEAPAICAAP
jgi:hypothetical protein